MNSARAINIARILYQDSLGYALSRAGKESAGLSKDRSFTYGEIAFETFPQILALANPKKGAFFDLGSGTGKAVILAALLGGWQKTYGIELLPELVAESNRILERFSASIEPLMKTEEPVPEIKFVQEDFFIYNWSDADCIFIQGTCIPNDTLKKLTKKFENLKSGAKIIVASALLPSNILRLEQTKNFSLDWGQATIYFYEKP